MQCEMHDNDVSKYQRIWCLFSVLREKKFTLQRRPSTERIKIFYFETRARKWANFVITTLSRERENITDECNKMWSRVIRSLRKIARDVTISFFFYVLAIFSDLPRCASKSRRVSLKFSRLTRLIASAHPHFPHSVSPFKYLSRFYRQSNIG